MSAEHPSPEKNPFDQLPAKEAMAIAHEFGITPSEVPELIIAGCNTLASFDVGSEYTAPSRNRVVSTPPSGMKLVQKKGVKPFSLLFDQKRLLNLIGSSSENGRPFFRMSLRRGDIDFEPIIDQWIEERGQSTQTADSTITAVIDHDQVPLVTRLFHYGIYDSEGTLRAILPFESSVTDLKVTDDRFSQAFPEGVYLRGLSSSPNPSEQERLMQLAEEIMKTTLAVDERLHISPNSRRHLSLILSTQGVESMALRRGDRSGTSHNTIYFSQDGLTGLRKNHAAEVKRSRIAHEYIHALDNVFSVGGRFLSEDVVDKLIAIVSRHLFADVEIETPQDKIHVDWPDNRKIERLFSERSLFSEGGDIGTFPGHASENIRELFVSTINSYLDPNYHKVVKNVSEKEGVDIDALFREIMSLLEERIREDERSQKPVSSS